MLLSSDIKPSMVEAFSKRARGIEWSEYLRVMESLVEAKRFRDAMLWIIGGCTAYRISDYVGLKWCDIGSKISINEKKGKNVKGKKARKVYIGEGAMAKIMLCKSGISPGTDQHYIFRRMSGGVCHITPHGANFILKGIGEEFGLGKISTHSLRKTLSMKIFDDRGKSYEALLFVSREILCHSSINTTIAYLGFTDNMVVESYENLL